MMPNFAKIGLTPPTQGVKGWPMPYRVARNMVNHRQPRALAGGRARKRYNLTLLCKSMKSNYVRHFNTL